MPLYTYACLTCGQETDDYRSVESRNQCPQCECGGETRKVISAHRVHGDMEPYYDDNLQTHITGRAHRERVMKEQGVIEGYGKGWDVSRRRSKH